MKTLRISLAVSIALIISKASFLKHNHGDGGGNNM
jgi:hypothetical protein